MTEKGLGAWDVVLMTKDQAIDLFKGIGCIDLDVQT
jgi:hypothetical protein